MVISKLDWAVNLGREKDIGDARNLIAAQFEWLAWPYIEHWCEAHNTSGSLAELRGQLGV